MSKTTYFATFLSLLILSACVGTSETKANLTEATQVAVEVTQTVTAIPQNELTLKMIENASLYAPQLQKTVQLQNGKYEGGSGANYALVQMLPQSTLGDLNGDGRPDAAVLLAENGGGSGVFISLVALLGNDNGFTESQAVLIDDRAQINSLKIEDRQILVDALIHGENDPMSSPSLKVMEAYGVSGDALLLTGLTETSGSTEHNIRIEAPRAGATAAGNIEVKGSMPVAPFENTLQYQFLSVNGKVLDEGPFTVKATDMGQPASFDNLLTLPQELDGTRVRLVLAELSAKDNSPICMTSVWITIQ